jgi:hypothetical protein
MGLKALDRGIVLSESFSCPADTIASLEAVGTLVQWPVP